MVKVYHARVWDYMAGDHKITPHKWILPAIQRIRGTPVQETEQDVSESALDGDGRYSDPKDNKNA